jgi:hypothetical protein
VQPHEIKVQSGSKALFACAETEEEAYDLVQRQYRQTVKLAWLRHCTVARLCLAGIDAARRARLAGDDGEQLLEKDTPGLAHMAANGMDDVSDYPFVVLARTLSVVQVDLALVPGAKLFTWGVGSVLAASSDAFQGISVPLRVTDPKKDL